MGPLFTATTFRLLTRLFDNNNYFITRNKATVAHNLREVENGNQPVE
jgi:hypothetical protein